jgi:hypothetical protein
MCLAFHLWVNCLRCTNRELPRFGYGAGALLVLFVYAFMDCLEFGQRDAGGVREALQVDFRDIVD